MDKIITVKNLIEKLQKCDENLEIFISDSEWGMEPCQGVCIVKPDANYYNGVECILLR